MAISKETIVEVSIKILNREGIENLTMRAIAKELGIKAASLYWHFKSKQELYGEISEYLCVHDCAMPPEREDTKEYLFEIYKAYRAMLLTTRDSVPILEDSIPTTPRRLEIIRIISEALLRMGIPGNHMMTASNLLNNYVLSFAADEVRIKSRTPEEITAFGAMLSLEGDMRLMIHQDFDEQFSYGLRVIFAGLEAEQK